MAIISGYNSTLKYKPKKTPGKNRSRRRNIIWFNPPFSKNVTTSVAKNILPSIRETLSKI